MTVIWHPVQARYFIGHRGVEASAAREQAQKDTHIRHGGHPDLDYNLEYPHYNSIAPFMQTRDQQTRQSAVEQLAQQYGLFYFYRGSDPIDVQMAGVVADFAKTNGISLIPVSVDGQVAASLPQSRPDTGQSRSMNITHFPALYLVDPRSKNYRALSYGFMTQDDLSKRFLNVATGFKPNS